MINLSTALRTAIAMRGYTSQRAFAHKTGLHYVSVNRWVSGEREPSLANLASLAESLDMEVSELIALGEQDKVKLAGGRK